MDDINMEDEDSGSGFYTFAGLAVLAVGGYLLWKRGQSSHPMPVFLPRTHVGSWSSGAPSDSSWEY